MQLNEANSQRKDLEKSSKYLPLALDYIFNSIPGWEGDKSKR